MKSSITLRNHLNKKIEEYLAADPECTYITNSFYNKHDFGEENEKLKKMFPHYPNTELEEKKQELEETILDWLWFVSPLRKQFNGSKSEELIIYFPDDINLIISNGIYYFTKTYYPKDGKKETKQQPIAIICQETKNYYHYTSYLQKIVLESFIYKKEKIKTLNKK